MLNIFYHTTTSSNGIEVYQSSINANKTILQNNKNELNIGVAGDKFDFNFNNQPELLYTSEIEQVYKIKLALGYTYTFNHSWSANALLSPEIASVDFTEINSNNVNFNATAYFTKKWFSTNNNYTKLSLGASYTSTFGKMKFIPVLDFYQKMNSKFSYAIGFPQTFANYQINTKNSFKAAISYASFYGGISYPINYFTNANTTLLLEYANTTAALQYSYNFIPDWNIFFSAGYTIYNHLELTNTSHEQVYNFNYNSKLNLAIGINYNFKL
ncbi:DUF6268 family outer membrane beta-barrel protein [Zhouia sp. PK063]